MLFRKLSRYKFSLLPCTFLLFVFTDRCLAQTPRFNWSEKFSTKGEFRFVGFKDSSVYSVQHRGKNDPVLRSFTPGLKLKEETILSFSGDEDPDNYLLSFVSDTGLVHVSYLHDKKRDSMFILTGGIRFFSMKAGSTSFVQAFYSADRSKLLICNFYYHRKTRNADRDFIVLSTATGALLYSGTFSYNYILETPESIDLDNLGNAYFGYATYQHTGSKLSGKSLAIHHIKLFSPRGTDTVFTFSFPGKYIPGMDVIQYNNNSTYIAGLAYDDDVKASRTSSADLFLYRIDPVRLLYTDSVYTTVHGLYPEGKLKEDDRLPYTIRHIYEKTTGELIVVTEQYQQIINQYATKEKYNDIACIQIKTDHCFGSLVRIPKLQSDLDNPSILGTFIDDKVFLLYNDLQENLSATSEAVKYVAHKKDKNGLFLITIGEDLTYKKELLYGYDAGQPIPVLRTGYAIDSRTIFLCSDEQVGLLKFLNE